MNLFKTSVLNGLSVLVKTVTMFILNKILAIYTGPAGYAMIGQYQNFIQIVTNFSGSAVNTGVVKYTAEYADKPNSQREIWRNAGTIIGVFSLLATTVLLLFSSDISVVIFSTTDYANVIRWFGIFLVFFNLNSFFLAILNGKKEIIKLVVANIVGSLLALLVTTIMAIKFNILGALIGLSIYQSLSFFVTLFLIRRSDWFKLNYLFGGVDIGVIKKLLSYVLMALVSAAFLPIAQTIIRNLLISRFSSVEAGYWDAMQRLSNAYLMLITTTLSVYYLPRLSELKNPTEIRKEVFSGFKLIFPMALLFGLMLYVCREWIVLMLFSKEFSAMESLFLGQVIGDSIKIASWILSYVMLSKAMTKLYIITELMFSIVLVLLTVILTNLFGFQNVTLAYVLAYIIYFVSLLIFVFKEMEKINAD